MFHVFGGQVKAHTGRPRRTWEWLVNTCGEVEKDGMRVGILVGVVRGGLVAKWVFGVSLVRID